MKNYLHAKRRYRPAQGLFFALIAILVALLSSPSTLSAQAAPATLSDDFTIVQWKPATTYSAVIATERADAATQLAIPNLNDADRTVYTGYDRMLSYMQADLAGNVSLESIAGSNYSKMLLEFPDDPVLRSIDVAGFTLLYKGLVIKLTQQ